MPQAEEPSTRVAAAVRRALHLDDAPRAIDLASPMITKVRIASAEGYSGAALRHVQVCVEQFEHALNSRSLSEKVLAYRAPTKPRFLRPGGLTNAEVLHTLRAGEATRRAGSPKRPRPTSTSWWRTSTS